MKLHILLMLLLVLLNTPVYAEPIAEIDAISNIDSLCGDTWCEGEYNFIFEEIICRKGNCYIYYVQESEPPVEGVCKITDATMSDFDDKMEDGERIADQIFDYFYGLR